MMRKREKTFFIKIFSNKLQLRYNAQIDSKNGEKLYGSLLKRLLYNELCQFTNNLGTCQTFLENFLLHHLQIDVD